MVSGVGVSQFVIDERTVDDPEDGSLSHLFVPSQGGCVRKCLGHAHCYTDGAIPKRPDCPNSICARTSAFRELDVKIPVYQYDTSARFCVKCMYRPSRCVDNKAFLLLVSCTIGHLRLLVYIV